MPDFEYLQLTAQLIRAGQLADAVLRSESSGHPYYISSISDSI